MRGALVLLACLAACQTRPAPAPAPSLAARLAARLAAFRGDVGVYVRHLATGAEFAHRADEVFPTASMIKAAIAAALLTRVDRGELDWHAELTYTTDRRYPGEDLLGAFADGSKVTLDKVAMLSITTSDNTAALWCQELAGGGGAVNDWLAAQGFVATRVNSRTPGREAAKAEFGWGQTTPREICELLVAAHEGRLGSPAVSDELQRLLGRVYWDGEALAAIPPWVHTLSKQGAVNASRSEVVLVQAPHGAYVFSVITNHQHDQGWSHDNEGFVLLRDVSALLWQHFEPQHPYTPPPGHQRFAGAGCAAPRRISRR
ncbi:MAG: serine hydrolase [Planctomycetes bacterium]|nr:serine hydrolase [Planctomycetota bacterium]